MEALTGVSSLWSGSGPCGKFACHSQPRIRVDNSSHDISSCESGSGQGLAGLRGKGSAVARGEISKRKMKLVASATKVLLEFCYE